MIRTYLDAGVLISAARGEAPLATKALDILDDPNRQFVSSVFLKLEILPKAVFNATTEQQWDRLTELARQEISAENTDPLDSVFPKC